MAGISTFEDHAIAQSSAINRPGCQALMRAVNSGRADPRTGLGHRARFAEQQRARNRYPWETDGIDRIARVRARFRRDARW
jgi:hypothetical protein